MACFSVNAPAPRSVAQESRDTLQAQVDLAPQQFAAEAQFQPQYAQLGLNTARQVIGGPNGLLDLYRNTLIPAGQDITSQSRQAEISDVQNLGPSATAAFKAANPQQSALLDELNSQALGDLKLGATLDPSLAREITQGVRGAQSARGFGYGPNDAYDEVLTRGIQAENLRNQRRAFAQSVVGQNASNTVDPFLAILGRPSQGLQTGAGLYGQASSAASAPKMFDPFNPYAADVYNTNYNANAAANIAGANNRASVVGSAIGAL